MSIFVLYKNSGVHSGRALRKQLDETYRGKVRGGFPKRFKGVCKREGEPEYVINLGTTEEYNIGSTFLNEREMVRTSSNKKAARKTFKEKGIRAPELYIRGADVTKFPVVGRTSYHSKGNGFWMCEDKRAVSRAVSEGATHFMDFIANTREYRVHTFIKQQSLENKERAPEDYVSVKISEKVWQGDGVPDPKEPQKNHQFGWVFLGPQNRRDEELDVVRTVAKQAISALGMDFGAVDVMYQIRNKLPYVLEVNSTPSLADDNADTCERYANRILKTIGKLKEE